MRSNNTSSIPDFVNLSVRGVGEKDCGSGFPQIDCCNSFTCLAHHMCFLSRQVSLFHYLFGVLFVEIDLSGKCDDVARQVQEIML